MAMTNAVDQPQAAILEATFLLLRPLLPRVRNSRSRAVSSDALVRAFANVAKPLADSRARGGLINLWAVAGLRRDEVRTASALAGLWRREFGGAISTGFLCAYLRRALPEIDWGSELASGYRVVAEFCPLGDIGDRVDLVVESHRWLVGIEVKIGALLGKEQLERYVASIERRAAISHRRAAVVLLAPFPPVLPGVACSSWRDVARAATEASRSDDTAFASQLIAKFGEYVQGF
jgi:hypothetical protein